MDDVEITNVESYLVANPWKPWVFVRLETNQGVHGISEATTHGKSRTVAEAIDELSDYFIGENPFNTEKIFLEMYRDEFYSQNIINTAAISAIDIACWDIKGKLLDQPLYDLIGGQVHGDSLKAYANGWYTNAADGDPAKFARAAEEVVEDGYDALKFDPFGDAWERMTQAELNNAVDVVRAVREAVGSDVDILIEGHGRFTPGMALKVANRLAEFNPTWFEEPCPPDSLKGVEQIARKSPIPIASGERRMGKQAFNDLLWKTDIDIIQPDLVKTGGITEAKKIAAMAESEHVSFAPHNPQGPISTTVCAHVCVTTPNFMIQEVFEDYDVNWKTDLLKDPVIVDDGRLQIPDGPGLGIELNMDAVREHKYVSDDQVHELNLFEKQWETRSLHEQ